MKTRITHLTQGKLLRLTLFRSSEKTKLLSVSARGEGHPRGACVILADVHTGVETGRSWPGPALLRTATTHPESGGGLPFGVTWTLYSGVHNSRKYFCKS